MKASILFNSGQTQRVCRSILAAEALHLAEALRAGDWIIVLPEEDWTGQVDLINWPEVIQRFSSGSGFTLHTPGQCTTICRRMAPAPAVINKWR